MNYSPNHKHLFEIDILRGIVVIALIIYHTAMYYMDVEKINWTVQGAIYVHTLTSFIVPVFIIISGLVLGRKYLNVQRIGNFYNKRLTSVVPQYIIISSLFIAMKVIFLGVAVSLTGFAFYYLTGSAHFHLWYFVLIIELYLLYPIIVSVYNYLETKIKIEYVLATLLIFQIIWNISSLYLIDTTQIEIIRQVILNRVIPVPSYIFYFVLGLYIGRNYRYCIQKIRNANTFIWLLLISIISVFITFNKLLHMNNLTNMDSIPHMIFWSHMILEPIMFIAIFILAMKYSHNLTRNNGNPMLSSLGKESFGIYLIHPLFLFIGIMLFEYVNIGPAIWLFYPIIFAFTIIMSYLAIIIIRYMPGNKWIIGDAR